MENQSRKIIQIAAVYDLNDEMDVVYALCNDGTLWAIFPGSGMRTRNNWIELPKIPQPVTGEQS